MKRPEAPNHGDGDSNSNEAYTEAKKKLVQTTTMVVRAKRQIISAAQDITGNHTEDADSTAKLAAIT